MDRYTVVAVFSVEAENPTDAATKIHNEYLPGITIFNVALEQDVDEILDGGDMIDLTETPGKSFCGWCGREMGSLIDTNCLECEEDLKQAIIATGRGEDEWQTLFGDSDATRH